jgi:hypothetical protein
MRVYHGEPWQEFDETDDPHEDLTGKRVSIVTGLLPPTWWQVKGKDDPTSLSAVRAYAMSRLLPHEQKRLADLRGGLLAASIERVTMALIYHIAFGWAAIPATLPVREYGVFRCSCQKRWECEAIGKHPVFGWNEQDMSGLPDIRETFGWWSQHCGNIAILTGARSGDLVVADVDPRHGGTLEALWEIGVVADVERRLDLLENARDQVDSEDDRDEEEEETAYDSSAL